MNKTNFQKIIEKILEKHGKLEEFKENQDGFHLRIENKPYMPLVIERHGEMICVTHYLEQNGDLIADPDVELHYPSWFPTGITQMGFGYRAKHFMRNGKQMVDLSFHNQVSRFLDIWAKNLEHQGWAK